MPHGGPDLLRGLGLRDLTRLDFEVGVNNEVFLGRSTSLVCSDDALPGADYGGGITAVV
jgi:hypothetical protein